MNISFKGIGDQYVTFAAAETAELGAVCKISANGTVDKCAADDAFCGVIAELRFGMAGVRMGGYVELPDVYKRQPLKWCQSAVPRILAAFLGQKAPAVERFFFQADLFGSADPVVLLALDHLCGSRQVRFRRAKVQKLAQLNFAQALYDFSHILPALAGDGL